jgi:hypothetical protein
MVSLHERYSDCEPFTVNDDPTLGELEEGASFRFFEDYQIWGPDKSGAVREALSQGLAVCIDVAGGSAQWQDYEHEKGALTNDGSPTDHYVTIIGCRGGHFFGHNSWGPDWGVWDAFVGSRGAFVADESVIEAASDIIVCVEHDE